MQSHLLHGLQSAVLEKHAARSESTHRSEAPYKHLISIQDDEAGAWSGFQVLLVATGKRDADVLEYLKSVALHNWLFGLEVAGSRCPSLTARTMPSAMQRHGSSSGCVSVLLH